jgi:hypothetical protein
MLAVPPRRGQRIKSLILPPFNGGDEFVPVLIEHSERKYGVIKKKGAHYSQVWIGHDLVPTKCKSSDLTLITLPIVPSRAYSEINAVIGGVGKHVRWSVIFPNKKNKTPMKLLVGDIDNKDTFSTFVKDTIRPFGLCRFEFDDDHGSYTTTVDVPDPGKIGTVAAAFHCNGYTATLLEDDSTSDAKLGIERYDRSEHMWWNQSQQHAGPLRDIHRWMFEFLPPSWSSIPFTWQSLARNITLDPFKESEHLPLPLRDFFLTNHIEALKSSNEPEKAFQLAQLRGKPSVTCRLSIKQNRQLLASAYWCIIAPFDKTTIEICQLIRFRYMLHGYTAREMGGYRQTAKHLGHGANIRKFRDKPQYKRENLSTKILNQIYKKDGSLRGSGFKGTRGKYGHTQFPRYEPRKRMKRTQVQEHQMRQVVSNVFTTYRTSADP